MNKLRVFEAFSGVGTQRMALRNLGIPHEVVAISEIDKFAIKSYEAIHGDVYNVGDISKVEVEDIPKHDLFTYSFPCQDISIAGKQQGLDVNSGTRSSLLWECNRIIESVKPKYLLMENVKNLVGKRHIDNFNLWLNHLESLGYTNYWDVLNARDYGIPQNRERVFVVSILGEHKPYEFPKGYDLKYNLSEYLELDVNSKFYLPDDKVCDIISRYQERYNLDSSITPIKELVNVQIGAIRGRYKHNPTSRIVGLPTVQMLELNDKGVSNCLTTVTKDNVVVEPRGSLKVVGNTSRTGHNAHNIYAERGISPTLTARDYKGSKMVMTAGDSNMLIDIRKLTPREYWRLMGISDSDFDSAQQVVSNSQLYKQAGNAIVVDVLYEIFNNLFKDWMGE